VSDPAIQLYCTNAHPIARGADWCGECGEPPARPRATRRCRWCGGDCTYWGNDVCPLGPRQIPRTTAEEK